jgi:hypothetical protein
MKDIRSGAKPIIFTHSTPSNSARLPDRRSRGGWDFVSAMISRLKVVDA